MTRQPCVLVPTTGSRSFVSLSPKHWIVYLSQDISELVDCYKYTCWLPASRCTGGRGSDIAWGALLPLALSIFPSPLTVTRPRLANILRPVFSTFTLLVSREYFIWLTRHESFESNSRNAFLNRKLLFLFWRIKREIMNLLRVLNYTAVLSSFKKRILSDFCDFAFLYSQTTFKVLYLFKYGESKITNYFEYTVV
jgi:hypothetical protein